MPLAVTNLEPIDPYKNYQSFVNAWAQRVGTLFKNSQFVSLKCGVQYALVMEVPTAEGREMVVSSSAQPEDFWDFFQGPITDAAFKTAREMVSHKELMRRLDRIEEASDKKIVNPNILQKHIPIEKSEETLLMAMRNLSEINTIYTKGGDVTDDATLHHAFMEDTEFTLKSTKMKHATERNDTTMTPGAWLDRFDPIRGNSKENTSPPESNMVNYLYPNRRLFKALYPKKKGVEPLLYSKLSLGATATGSKILMAARKTGGDVNTILQAKHKARRAAKKRNDYQSMAARIKAKTIEKRRRRRDTGMKKLSLADRETLKKQFVPVTL